MVYIPIYLWLGIYVVIFCNILCWIIKKQLPFAFLRTMSLVVAYFFVSTRRGIQIYTLKIIHKHMCRAFGWHEILLYSSFINSNLSTTCLMNLVWIQISYSRKIHTTTRSTRWNSFQIPLIKLPKQFPHKIPCLIIVGACTKYFQD